LLILGGTRDGKLLAAHLHALLADTTAVIYSIAGLVRTPELPCTIISGGFGQYGGLSRYIKENNITAILDATHPYAARISATAILAARANNIPYWQWQRAAWKPQPDDSWVEFDSWDYLLPKLSRFRSVFLAIGRPPELVLNYCLDNPQIQFTIRSAVPSDPATGDRMQADNIIRINEIGPLPIAEEQALFDTNDIDIIVCKNSGGNATAAKLQVARNSGLPVFMLKRPHLPLADKSFQNTDECERYITSFYQRTNGHEKQASYSAISGQKNAV
jgi:precorrin-6A/cobalt-precorrin-6A reductase